MKRVTKWALCLLLALQAAPQAMPAGAQTADLPPVVVGRVYQIEGELLRYVPEESDWVPMVGDAPFAAGDALLSGQDGRAELIVPNGAWIRVGGSTEVEFTALEPDWAEMEVSSGVARFYNKGPEATLKAACPFGYVLANPGTAFDFYVGEDSVEVVAVKGTVSFFHGEAGERFDVAAGAPSLFADREQVSQGEETADPEWDGWNAEREAFWAAKAALGVRSAEYLPPGLRFNAYVFDEYGTWEMLPYEGRRCWFWRPTRVAAGWSPFTVGRWTDWDGDQTWIPAEPFGYVTHHYGNWVYLRNRWCWAPPVVGFRIGLPFLDVDFHWYPGRVGWIYSGVYVGWVPLAPRETYYCRRHWGGPHTVVVAGLGVGPVSVSVRNYAYVSRAVVVSRDNFYRVNDYRKVRVTSVNRTTLIGQYRAAPVIGDAVIRDYRTDRQRFSYTDRKRETAADFLPREPRRGQGRTVPDFNTPRPERRGQEQRKPGAVVPQPERRGQEQPAPAQERGRQERPPAREPVRPPGAPAPPARVGRPAQPAAPPPPLERTTPPGRVQPERPGRQAEPGAVVPQPGRRGQEQPAPTQERGRQERPPAREPVRTPGAPAPPAQVERPAQPAAPPPPPERATPPGRVQPERPGRQAEPGAVVPQPGRRGQEQPAPAQERGREERPPAREPVRPPATPAPPVQVERPAAPAPRPEQASPAVQPRQRGILQRAPAPERPAQPATRQAPPVLPAPRPERAAPSPPAETRPYRTPAPAPQITVPPRPAEVVRPAQPAPQVQPQPQPQRVAPATSVPQTTVLPEAHEKAAEPGQPVQRDGRTAPERRAPPVPWPPRR